MSCAVSFTGIQFFIKEKSNQGLRVLFCIIGLTASLAAKVVAAIIIFKML